MDRWNGMQHGDMAGCCGYNRSIDEIDKERNRSGWNPYEGEEEPEWETEIYGENEMKETMDRERDLRLLQSMYPGAAKILMPHIMEECDKMEQEGSVMYDRYPDNTTVRRIAEKIYNKVENRFPPQLQPEPDEMLMMQTTGNRQNAPGQNWVQDLIRVMLLQEMHHRRCRYRDCSKLWRMSRSSQLPRRPGRRCY